MSHQAGREGTAYYQLDDGEIVPDPYDPNMPRIGGGDASYHPNGGVGNNGWCAEISVTGTGAGCGRLSPLPADEGVESDFYEVPATDFYAARRTRRDRRQRSSASVLHASNGGSFDFNDNEQPNPWHGAEQQRQYEPENKHHHEPELDAEIKIRRFANCRDKELRTYLAARLVSTGFLTEIDQFLQGHPEIASCAEGRNMLHQVNTLSPLQAYRYFLKGYTRPARYLDGIIRTDAFPLPANHAYQHLSTKSDPELLEFFDGFDYRHDIIERIDEEVHMGTRKLLDGGQVSLSLRKLICYAIWGNPVDAYKHYEYAYQNEYMPHRYLPEHVILSHVPKPSGYTGPRPSIDLGYKKHHDVRSRMARANDQGVDVLDVLIAEYRFALVRRAHRRVEIDALVSKAKERLERERQDPTGEAQSVDIVDMIMDDAVTRQGTNRRNYKRHIYPRNHKTYNLRSYGITFNGVKMNGGTHTFTRLNERRAPGFLQAQAAELRQAKAILLRLYTQEQSVLTKRGVNARHSTLQIVRASRASAERRYVNCLIRYCRDANRMTASQANQLQKDFTREKMSDLGISNGNYLLGMYPRELY